MTPADDPSPTTPQVPPWIKQVSTVSWGFVGLVLAVAILVVIMGALRQLVIPLFLGGFLAVIFSPLVGWLAERRVPRPMGAVLVLLLITAMAIGVIAVLVAGIVDQSDELAASFDDVVAEIDVLLEQAELTEAVDDILEQARDAGPLLGEGAASTVGSVVGTTTGFFSGLFLGAVMLYYLLKDGPMLVRFMVRTDDEDRAAHALSVLDDAAATTRTYFKARTVLALIQAVVIGVIAVVIGVPLAFAIALVNFVGGYIPYVGGLVGGAFAVLLALSAGGIPLALIMLIVVMAVSVGLENLLEPALLGDRLGLHPIVILFATVGGGLVVGIIGMILTAPLVAIGRSLWSELTATGFFERPNA